MTPLAPVLMMATWMVLGLADIATSLGGRIARGGASVLRGISSLAVMSSMLVLMLVVWLAYQIQVAKRRPVPWSQHAAGQRQA